MIFLQTFIVLCFGFMGASIASFLCVVFERVPKGESINGRSHCACGRQLTWWENVPIIGWLRIKGKAKCCGAKLPTIYLIAELTGFVGFMLLGLLFINLI